MPDFNSCLNRVVNNIYRNGLKVFVKFWLFTKIISSFWLSIQFICPIMYFHILLSFAISWNIEIYTEWDMTLSD